MPSITCTCGKQLTYREDWAGRMARCNACGADIRLPASAAAAGIEPPASPLAAFAAADTIMPAVPASGPPPEELGDLFLGVARAVSCLLFAGGGIALVIGGVSLSSPEGNWGLLLWFGPAGLFAGSLLWAVLDIEKHLRSRGKNG